MNRKMLEDLGLPKEAVDQIMEANNADIEREKSKAAPIIADRDALKTQLEGVQASLAAFDGVDVAKLKGEIDTLKTSIADADAKHQTELAKRDQAAQTSAYLAGKKLVNALVSNALAQKINAALDDPQHKGKNRDDLFKEFTQDAEGKPIPGLLTEDNPHKPLFGLPPSGSVTPEKMAQLGGQMGTLAATTAKLNEHRIIGK